MHLARLVLVVLLTLSASLSPAMAAGHWGGPDHARVETGAMNDDPPHCCDEGSERGQACHVLPALDPAEPPDETLAGSGKVRFVIRKEVLTEVALSGPLDPPRAA